MYRPCPPYHQVRFGEFQLDLQTAELQNDGHRLMLQDQPFQVLTILLEQPGRLVTRTELKNRLWPSDTFVDFDHGLNKAVNRLREALGDSAESPRFIETLPRRGYRFIFPVSVPTQREHVDIGQPTLSQFPTKETTGNIQAATPRRSRHLVSAVCIGILAAMVVTYHYWPHSKSPNVLSTTTRISHWNKEMGWARISPNGHNVVFASPVGGDVQLFVMLTSGGEPLQVTNDAGDKSPDGFSPDGTEIYYQREDGGDEVWMVPTLGGTPRRIISGLISGVPAVLSSDGAFIFYRKFDNPGIFRADKSGLNEQMVYKSDNTDLSFYPLLAFPGGNDLLVAGWKEPATEFHLFRISLVRHEAVDLGEVTSGDPFIAWAEPGNSVFLSRTVKGLTNIWKYDLKDHGFTQTTFGPGGDYCPMPDPTGKGIYIVNSKFSGVLTAYFFQSKQSKEIASALAFRPEISPDGKRVMYTTFDTPRSGELWVSDIDGTHKLRLATGAFEPGTWAPDNTWLSYWSEAEGKAYIVRADGDGLRQIPEIGHTLIYRPVWSPNQKSIYLTTIEKEGALQKIWKWGLDSSRPPELVEKCGTVLDVAPGEQYLLGYGKGIGIFQVSVSDRKCTSVIPGVETGHVTFAPDGKSFLYTSVSRGEISIFRQGWKDGKLIGAPQAALKVPFISSFKGSYNFSRDLSTIVYERPRGNDDLYLLSQK